MERASPSTLEREVAEAAKRREVKPSPYLDHVRRTTERIISADATADDARSALLVVEDYVGIDVDVPTASRLRPLVPVKVLIKRLTGWYFAYVAHRITLLGYAIVRFGIASLQLTEDLQENVGVLRQRIDDLQARVDRLEQKDHVS
jgi:hypothetical protein